MPTTVRFTAVDSCGDLLTFVGGGATAGFRRQRSSDEYRLLRLLTCSLPAAGLALAGAGTVQQLTGVAACALAAKLAAQHRRQLLDALMPLQ